MAPWSKRTRRFTNILTRRIPDGRASQTKFSGLAESGIYPLSPPPSIQRQAPQRYRSRQVRIPRNGLEINVFVNTVLLITPAGRFPVAIAKYSAVGVISSHFQQARRTRWLGTRT